MAAAARTWPRSGAGAGRKPAHARLRSGRDHGQEARGAERGPGGEGARGAAGPGGGEAAATATAEAAFPWRAMGVGEGRGGGASGAPLRSGCAVLVPGPAAILTCDGSRGGRGGTACAGPSRERNARCPVFRPRPLTERRRLVPLLLLNL